jgi:hypothetical protein
MEARLDDNETWQVEVKEEEEEEEKSTSGHRSLSTPEIPNMTSNKRVW